MVFRNKSELVYRKQGHLKMSAGKRNSLSKRESERGAGRRGLLNVTEVERVFYVIKSACKQ